MFIAISSCEATCSSGIELAILTLLRCVLILSIALIAICFWGRVADLLDASLPSTCRFTSVRAYKKSQLVEFPPVLLRPPQFQEAV